MIRGAAVRAVVLGLHGLLVLAACGGGEDKGKTSAGAKASCAADDDCTISTRTNCCQACPDAPLAVPKFSVERMTARCENEKCKPNSDRVECPKTEPESAYVAKCVTGTCTATKR